MYPPDCILAHNPARPCRPKGGFGLVMMMMMLMLLMMTTITIMITTIEVEWA